MGIIIWLVFGALAGWIASIIAGNNAEQGAIGNIVVGIIGAFLGGFIMSLIGGDGVNEFSIYSLLVAIGGAVLVIYFKQALTK